MESACVTIYGLAADTEWVLNRANHRVASKSRNRVQSRYVEINEGVP